MESGYEGGTAVFPDDLALAPMVDRPCGVVDLEIDQYAIDSATFGQLVDGLVGQYLASNHTVLKGMLAGYPAPAVVLVERRGRTVAALTSPIERSTAAISLNVDAFDPAADQRELIRLAAEASRSMPTA